MRIMTFAIEAIEDLGVRNQIRFLIGGAPVTEAFASELSPGGFAADASRVAALVKSMVH